MNTLPELETWLADHELTWRLEAVPLDRIDQVAGLANQARSIPLDEDVVDRYAVDMADGATFPPIVLTEQGARLTPIGGNHRLAAASRANRTTVDAYIVTGLTTDLEIRLALEDNRRHGVPLSDDERIFHARRLITQGAELADAASTCGIAVHKIQRHLDADRCDERARGLGVRPPEWSDLSITTRQRLVAIRHDKVFARAAELAAEGGIRAGEIVGIVSKVNNAATPAEAIQLLIDIEQVNTGRTRRPTGRPPSALTAARRRLLGDLDGILNYTPEQIIGDRSAGAETLVRQAHATAMHLQRIARAVRDAEEVSL
ncbi:MAG: ParB N-terminal domain-containing protein [Acidimicrobiia bacterium]|nr:ParB N-terminal domain-containing protein [Acidimicrobiia bacterium]